MDGSVGVLARPGERPLASHFAGPQFPAGVALERGRTRIALAPEAMSAGLLRLVPERTPAPGRWTLTGTTAPVELLFGPSAEPPPPVPSLARVELRTQPVRFRWTAPQSALFVTAELSAPSPGALLVVRFSPTGGIDQQRWVPAGATTAPLWQSVVGPCGMQTPGATPPGARREAFARWVDRVGRVSAEQARVAVVRR
jgi:hypothetical protein